jgi:hypothetical protein
MGSSWKSTAQGILSAFALAAGPLSAFLAEVERMKPNPDYTLAMIAAGLTCAAAIAKAWIGYLQNDAQPIPFIAATIVANGGLVATAEKGTLVAPSPLKPTVDKGQL